MNDGFMHVFWTVGSMIVLCGGYRIARALLPSSKPSATADAPELVIGHKYYADFNESDGVEPWTIYRKLDGSALQSVVSVASRKNAEELVKWLDESEVA